MNSPRDRYRDYNSLMKFKTQVWADRKADINSYFVAFKVLEKFDFSPSYTLSSQISYPAFGQIVCKEIIRHICILESKNRDK